MPRTTILVSALALVLASSTVACKKLPFLSKSSDDGGADTTSSGILGSMFDSSFEGEITTEVKAKNDPTPKTLVFGIKSPKLRADIGALATPGKDDFLSQGASFILDPPSKKAYVLMPAKKMAMVIDFDKMKQQGHGPHGASSSSGSGSGGKVEDPPKLDKTGKKEVVAGYTCEDWKLTNKDGSRADLCMAEGIKLMDFTDLASQSPEFAAAAAFGDLNHFPLKAVAYDKAGAEDGRIEAKKIEKKKLPDTDFTIPAGYQQMDMAQMIASMAGGHAGPPGGGPPGGWPPGRPHPGLPPNFKPPQGKH